MKKRTWREREKDEKEDLEGERGWKKWRNDHFVSPLLVILLSF